MAMSSVSVAEANIATFRRAIEEGWNKGNLEAIDELFVPDFVEHQVGIGPGRDAVKGSIRSLRIAFPDLHLTFEDVVAEGDMVWARLSGAGTHEGPFMGLPGTGRRMRVDVIDIVRVADGRLVEHWGVADRLSVAQQIGLVPGGSRENPPRRSPEISPRSG
jgi:predicted ester cyclase